MSRIDNPRAGQILNKLLGIAEQRYGPRTPGYRIRGVRFRPDIEAPQTSFSGPANKDLHVLINSQYRTEPDRVCYQMAHESIHLLSPVSRAEVIVLEEGLAVHFQVSFMTSHYRNVTGYPASKINWDSSGEPDFERARQLYAELLKIEIDAIKKLREIQPLISLITPDLILCSYPQLSHPTAKELCSKFEPWRNRLNPSQ